MDETEFPAQRYPFQLDEGVRLFSTLTSSIADTGQIDLLYKQGGGAELEQLNQGWSISKLWNTALDEISLAGGLTPFLRVLSNHPYEQVRLHAKALLTAPPPTRRRIFSSEIVILDRRNLRDAIDLLANDSSRCRVIVVRGGARSGKTHGRYLFEEAGRSRGAEVVYLAEGIVSTVDEVASMLFGAYDHNSVPPRDTTEDAWYRSVCVELKKLASTSRTPLWIVADNLGLDDFGNPLLDPEIVRFLDHFAMLLSSPMIGNWFRLMLINYPDRPTPTKWPPELYKEDETTDSDVQREHVVDGFREWAIAAGRALHEQQLEDLAREVLDIADTSIGDCRLRRIHSAFNIHIAALAGEHT